MMRLYEAIIRHGDYYETIFYESSHRVGSRANDEDALREWSRRHEKWVSDASDIVSARLIEGAGR